MGALQLVSLPKAYNVNGFGIDISPKAIELLKLRLERQLKMTEDRGILGKLIHHTEPPHRTDFIEPRQIHLKAYLVRNTNL